MKTNKIYRQIETKVAKGEKMLAVLLDPEKCVGNILTNILNALHDATPDFIFIGGSTQNSKTDELMSALDKIDVPKVLFPGDVSQFTRKADAILYLSLISGRNPDYLIEQHVKSAREINRSNVEVIPTGYILVEGGTYSSVSRVSKTKPIPQHKTETITDTALAGQLLGMKLIYLEAGSGATIPVSTTIIQRVKKELQLPLIVGGGITSVAQLRLAYHSGADIIVVGNLFEKDADKISLFLKEKLDC